MSTLLLRLCGPLQSWGMQSKFDIRDTGYEPSKSGVVGLLCAALGRPRHAPLDDLAGLRMGVRVDREGRLARDYHTAGKGGYYRVSGGVEKKALIVTTRYYLADACFLVGLEGDLPLLERLYAALHDPVWPLYLGRKAFVPGAPVWLEDGLRIDETLEEALERYEPLAPGPDQLRTVMDDPERGEIVRPDVPVSFAERRFMLRRVRVGRVRPPRPAEEVT